ncbi:class F sortase [Nocardioides bizhenqiangii]|uniref:Class F sortase n=1 Tax=Nocardioides bizhenqiangii TaxID=3095076 RepID=A0ABZ0ZN91_9ACTN|nr:MULTISPECIES: class F sortase [unclassified Nocardioides]MDZ5621619.1 class F sortase [Nocardioides sp. HM23]WQQ25545.1 class F sortase [Nocardioides sp. HM61]
MLLLVAICTTLGGVLLAVGFSRPDQQPAGEGARSPARSTSEAPAPAPLGRDVTVTQRQALTPARLKIPAIDVTTPLVRLGLMPDRTVEVPRNPDRAGWFQPGPVPGQRGSAVILGHVDSVRGPAVFARLQELQLGDAVTIERADGSTVRFVVSGTMLYENADFPADRVYAAQDGRRLNLVTCGGTYDSTRGGYQSNLVVYTRFAPARVG